MNYSIDLSNAETARLKTVFGEHKRFIGGGFKLAGATSFGDNISLLVDTADMIETDDGQVKVANWLRSTFPFGYIRNGDVLGIMEYDSKCPVVYLSHEDRHVILIIAWSFDDFLLQWEEMCYISPLMSGALSRETEPCEENLYMACMDEGSSGLRLLREVLRAE